MQGYCLKCKEKREMKDIQALQFKNDRPATRGTCIVCSAIRVE